MIQFNKFNVVNKTTGAKARVHYSRFNLMSTGEDCVTIYAKDYGHALEAVFGDALYENNTDTQTDYFEHGRVRIKSGHPLFAAAAARCN